MKRGPYSCYANVTTVIPWGKSNAVITNGKSKTVYQFGARNKKNVNTEKKTIKCIGLHCQVLSSSVLNKIKIISIKFLSDGIIYRLNESKNLNKQDSRSEHKRFLL